MPMHALSKGKLWYFKEFLKLDENIKNDMLDTYISHSSYIKLFALLRYDTYVSTMLK